MERKPFGQTGLTVPPIVFGTSSLGNMYVPLPDDVQRAIVAEWFASVERPIVVDSAGKYGAGLALENIGRHLKGLRIAAADVVISNKLGWIRVPLESDEPTFEPGVWVDLEYDAVQDISYDGILRCYEQGCQLLGDYPPQLVSVHDPDEYLQAATDEADRESRWNDIAEAYRALSELKRDGKVIGVGVGSKDWTTIREFDRRYDLDWVMIANSFTIHSHPGELLELIEQLSKKNVAVINSAVFNAGFLVGGDFYNYRRISSDTEEGRQLLRWREQFFNVCTEFDVKPATACVAFGKSPPGVTAVTLSSTKPERVRTNVDSVAATLPDAFWQALKDRNLLAANYPYLPATIHGHGS